jgi:hypothetical protein
MEKCNGNIKVKLTDLGATWLIQKQYQWKSDGDCLEIRPVDDFNKVLKLPKIIPLTPRRIAFLGLYDGDGNKARDGERQIGFSQREINIHKFANDMFFEIFGSQFTVKWSILEDTRRFETNEMKQELEKLQSRLSGHYPTRFDNVALQKEYLKREFLSAAQRVNLQVDDSQLQTPVVSPKKGARASGKSSLEYIQNLAGSEKFLPLWLKIVRTCTDSIILNQQCVEDVVVFNGYPREISFFELDVKRYVGDIRWATGRGNAKYLLSSLNEDFFEIAKSKKVRLSVRRRLKMTPFIFLSAGIYLAEGDTKKDDIFIFENVPVSLNVALTSSEAEYIQTFVELLETIGKDLVKSWKVKVGTKYEWETEELAQRLGTITLRAGEKGQGYVRTLELDEELKNWGLKNHPILDKYSHLYHHAEITGVGIPRVHVLSSAQLAPYFISLIRDSIFNLPRIAEYTTNNGETL